MNTIVRPSRLTDMVLRKKGNFLQYEVRKGNLQKQRREIKFKGEFSCPHSMIIHATH